jgi:hypothetical protein
LRLSLGTNINSYVAKDLGSRACIVIDSVMDIDCAAIRLGTRQAALGRIIHATANAPFVGDTLSCRIVERCARTSQAAIYVPATGQFARSWGCYVQPFMRHDYGPNGRDPLARYAQGPRVPGDTFRQWLSGTGARGEAYDADD